MKMNRKFLLYPLLLANMLMNDGCKKKDPTPRADNYTIEAASVYFTYNCDDALKNCELERIDFLGYRHDLDFNVKIKPSKGITNPANIITITESADRLSKDSPLQAAKKQFASQPVDPRTGSKFVNVPNQGSVILSVPFGEGIEVITTNINRVHKKERFRQVTFKLVDKEDHGQKLQATSALWILKNSATEATRKEEVSGKINANALGGISKPYRLDQPSGPVVNIYTHQ